MMMMQKNMKLKTYMATLKEKLTKIQMFPYIYMETPLLVIDRMN